MDVEREVVTVTVTTTTDSQRRDVMENFIRRTGWSIVLKDIATERWGRDVTVNIAERGTFKGVPAKGFTNTETGTIYMREEIFDGIDLNNTIFMVAVNTVTRMLIAGEPINREGLIQQIGYYHHPSKEDAETIWRIAQTVTANYGVLGHEYCHAAYSEHAGRAAFHMGLEDLRGESLWMAQDPIRARQGLRACAATWVTHDTSPMAGDKAFDLSQIQSHSDMLHLYLLIAGRGRIGVLDDQSVLVTGVVDLAVDILGYEVVSDADDIIDRYLETSEDPSDVEGAAQRAALAKEFSGLLPKTAKPPTGEIGCFCDPKAESDQGEGEESGEGAGGQDGDDTESGDEPGQQGQPGSDQGEGDESGKGEGEGEGDQPGDESGEGAGDQPGDEPAEGDGAGSNLGEGDIDGESGAGSGSQDDKGEESGASDDTGDTEDTGSDEKTGPTVGTDKGGADDSDGGESNETGDDPDFITGTFGETIRPGHEDVTDTLDDSDAFRLTQEQIEALAEILTEGLEEVADDESEAGWGISDEAGAVLTSRSVAPVKVASEVFSKQALATRNRRLKR